MLYEAHQLNMGKVTYILNMYIVAEKQYILRSCHVSQTQPNKKTRGPGALYRAQE